MGDFEFNSLCDRKVSVLARVYSVLRSQVEVLAICRGQRSGVPVAESSTRGAVSELNVAAGAVL